MKMGRRETLAGKVASFVIAFRQVSVTVKASKQPKLATSSARSRANRPGRRFASSTNHATLAMKRGRDPHDDPRSGPSKNQLRGLTFTAQQPAFLRNAMAALSGQPSSAPGTNGRPAIPTRPEGMEDEPESDPDEWDLGRGEEAPTVVVLKEGKHIDQCEVDRLRAQGALASPFSVSGS